MGIVICPLAESLTMFTFDHLSSCSAVMPAIPARTLWLISSTPFCFSPTVYIVKFLLGKIK
jgi:hypothetical protein